MEPAYEINPQFLSINQLTALDRKIKRYRSSLRKKHRKAMISDFAGLLVFLIWFSTRNHSFTTAATIYTVLPTHLCNSIAMVQNYWDMRRYNATAMSLRGKVMRENELLKVRFGVFFLELLNIVVGIGGNKDRLFGDFPIIVFLVGISLFLFKNQLESRFVINKLIRSTAILNRRDFRPWGPFNA